MAQRFPLFDEAVEAAETAEDAVLRLVWRDGRIDEDEEEVVAKVRRSVVTSDRSAHAVRTGLALIRCGEESPRVTRLRRDVVSGPPEAA